MEEKKIISEETLDNASAGSQICEETVKGLSYRSLEYKKPGNLFVTGIAEEVIFYDGAAAASAGISGPVGLTEAAPKFDLDPSDAQFVDVIHTNIAPFAVT